MDPEEVASAVLGAIEQGTSVGNVMIGLSAVVSTVTVKHYPREHWDQVLREFAAMVAKMVQDMEEVAPVMRKPAGHTVH